MEQPSFLPHFSGLSILFRLPSLHGFALAVSAGLEVPWFSLTVVALFYSSSLHTFSDPVVHLHLSQSNRRKIPQLRVGVQGIHYLQQQQFCCRCNIVEGMPHQLLLEVWETKFFKVHVQKLMQSFHQSPFSCPCVLSFLSSLNYHGQNFIKVNMRMLSE